MPVHPVIVRVHRSPRPSRDWTGRLLTPVALQSGLHPPACLMIVITQLSFARYMFHTSSVLTLLTARIPRLQRSNGLSAFRDAQYERPNAIQQRWGQRDRH